MKMTLAALALAAMLAGGLPAHAKGRADPQNWPIADILAHPKYAETVGDFKFKFGGKASGAVISTTRSTGSTNGFGKSDHDACVWAALGALKKFRDLATREGATSVQGITSITSGAGLDSATEFQCISGTASSRVIFNGSLVK